uniref:Protein kinase domain-containing protein n=2 Tax=Macrostomum lignano TaxID=282301 RepID=A0A1I8GWD3_9PLAT
MSLISYDDQFDGEKTRSSHSRQKKQLQVSVMACPAFDPIQRQSYRQIELTVSTGPIASGTFGSVYRGRLSESGESVALKRVLQDPRYKNRELRTLYTLGEHENLVRLRYHYYCRGKMDPGKLYLHLVTELFPESLLDLLARYRKAETLPSMLKVRIFAYQLLRAINYMHSHRICHRDIKSPNVLVDESDCRLRLCDFGSAKELPLPGEVAEGGGANAAAAAGVAYISSRYYRAPELLFGSTNYSCAIDLWSVGCVLAELCIGHCLFMANNSLDQLVAIIRVLGTPTKRDLLAMNPVYEKFPLPQVAPDPQLSFPIGTPPELLDLLCRLLAYQPGSRLAPLRALAHPFFDELRQRLPSDKLELFNFSQQELGSADRDLLAALKPSYSN